jgi:hypothetical protein
MFRVPFTLCVIPLASVPVIVSPYVPAATPGGTIAVTVVDPLPPLLTATWAMAENATPCGTPCGAPVKGGGVTAWRYYYIGNAGADRKFQIFNKFR